MERMNKGKVFFNIKKISLSQTGYRTGTMILLNRFVIDFKLNCRTNKNVHTLPYAFERALKVHFLLKH